ncbi:MAG: RelA/SpoT domain-containing protein [Cyclobacteriaceae bacterium]
MKVDFQQIPFSKTQIRKLGDQIRKDLSTNGKLDPILLSKLESYRSSYINSITEVFSVVSEAAKNIRHDAISTFRIKRIESIIGKLKRYPSMELDRMWDIAGCRCILNIDIKVLKLLSVLESKLEIKKVNDYNKNPQDSGYRSIHIYVKLSENDKNIVEIQLRNKNDHNWATLVEIVDLLFDKKIKEGQEDLTFNRFHLLMSRINDVTLEERSELIEIIHSSHIFKSLLSVFAKNYLKVRIKFLELNRNKNDHFFVITAKKDETPDIRSFSTFSQAEDCYFEQFKSGSNENTVMTFLPQTNFTNLEMAYSNYTLTTHTFIDDYFKVIENAIIDLIDQKKYKSFFKVYSRYLDNYKFYRESIHEEIETMKEYSQVKHENGRKLKNWVKDFKKRMDKRGTNATIAQKRFRNKIPTSGSSKLLFNLYMWRTRTKIKNLGL